jgi:paraquat-inducible protein B
MNSEPPTQPRRTAAIKHHTWWPGWVWSIPIAAIGVVAWLTLRALSSRGIDVDVRFAEAAQMKAGATRVLHQGIDVGTVHAVSLDRDGSHVIAHLDLDRNMESFLTSNSTFYLEGAHPSLSNPASLGAIVSGPTIILVAARGKPQRSFNGVIGQPREPLAVRIPYAVRFKGDVGALQVGSPVKLRGFTVGEVASVELNTDAASGTVATPVVLVLDPTRFHIQGGAEASLWRVRMNDTLGDLVQHGLRAQLGREPPLIGATQVSLVMVPAEAAPGETGPPASLRTAGRYPEIPVTESGNLDRVLAEVGRVPLAQIADNIRDITADLRAVTHSPELRESLTNVDRASAELEKTLHAAGPQVAPTIRSLHAAAESLRSTAAEIEATSATARKEMGGTSTSQDGNLQQALTELTDAARAIRSLADYLDQHPESLLRGR